MDWTQVAVGLSALAALGTVYNGWVSARNSRDATQEENSRSRLELAFTMQEKQIERMSREIDNQAKALQTEAQARMSLDNQLQECKAGRHQLEVQVEILKLQIGGGHGPADRPRPT